MTHSTNTRLARLLYEQVEFHDKWKAHVSAKLAQINREFWQCVRESERANLALRKARESLPAKYRKKFDATYRHWMDGEHSRKP